MASTLSYTAERHNDDLAVILAYDKLEQRPTESALQAHGHILFTLSGLDSQAVTTKSSWQRGSVGQCGLSFIINI